MSKILRCMGNGVVMGNQDVKFSHETGGKLHTSGATPEGYFTIPVSDRQQLQQVSWVPVFLPTDLFMSQVLGLPQLQWEDRFEMVKLGTGEYILRRAHAVLTGARCAELGAARAEGRTGSMRQYNQLARHLPQVIVCDGEYCPFWPLHWNRPDSCFN